MKILPHNLSVEKSFLAGILLGGEDYIDWSLQPTDFYNKSHQRIYNEMQKSSKGGLNPDAVTVASFLPDLISNINLLLDSSTSPALNPQYGKIIKRFSQQRQLIVEYSAAVENLFIADNLSECLESLDDSVNAIMSVSGKRRGGVSAKHVYLIDDAIASYENHTENLKKNTLKTHITKIDNTIRGVAPGEVLTIMARAGSFKTALLQNILLNHAESSNTIAAFFSLEMPVPMVFERYMQNVYGLQGIEIERAYKTKNGKEISNMARERLRNVAIIPKKVSLKQILAYIPIIERKAGKKVSVVGVDYLGLVDSTEKGEYAKNSEIATGAKDLAKEANLPVVILSQVKRHEAGKSPSISLSDGRGSGAIEEGADFLLGMWREEDKLVCEILKNRKGPIGNRYELIVDGEHMRFDHNCFDYVPLMNNKASNEGL